MENTEIKILVANCENILKNSTSYIQGTEFCNVQVSLTSITTKRLFEEKKVFQRLQIPIISNTFDRHMQNSLFCWRNSHAQTKPW
jgi:hypothetical protein